MVKKIQFEVGDKVIAYLRNSVGEKIPIYVTIKKISKIFGNNYLVLTDAGGEFSTRLIKKIIK